MGKTKNVGIGQGIGGGHPHKWESPEILQEEIEKYYVWAKENEKHITITGLGWWLGTGRQTLINYQKANELGWLKRLDDTTRRKYMDTIKEAKQRIEMEAEERLYDRSKATGSIFSLKNNFHWVDKQEIVTTNDSNLDNISNEELEKKLEILEK